jgi:hypothetical protein
LFMPIDADIRAKEDRLLVELTDLAMDLARDFAAEAKQAKQAGRRDEAERCTQAFDRMARSARLSIALRRRLQHDDGRHEAQRNSEAVDLRKARLRARLRSEIKAGDYAFKARLDCERELEERLAEDALYQSFLDLPFDEALTRLRDKLGLQVPPPQGERDRASRRDTEEVETHSHRRALHPVSPGAPPEAEQLVGLRPAPS